MNYKYKNIAILNLVSFVGFWIIAFLFISGLKVGFDNFVYNAISPLISDTTTTIMVFVTNLGSTKSIIIICVLLLIIPKTARPYGLPVTLTVICSSILNTLLKMLFARERPDILRLVDAGGFSFPSGHSMNNMALYTIIVLLLLSNFKDTNNKNINTIYFIFIIPITIGISRIYLGVHYPSDVLAGLLAGYWVGSSVFILLKKYTTKI